MITILIMIMLKKKNNRKRRNNPDATTRNIGSTRNSDSKATGLGDLGLQQLQGGRGRQNLESKAGIYIYIYTCI